MKVGSPNSTRQNQARPNQSAAGFNLPLPTNQAVYSNLAGAAIDWDMIEADLGARLDWNGVVEVQAPTGLARGFYLNSKFSSGIVSSGGEITPCDTQTMRSMTLQHGARLNIFALSANLVRLSIASSDWQIQRDGLAKEVFHAWAAELEANRGSGALEVSVLSGRRGILAFEFGVRTLTVFQALTSLSFDETALEWLNALAGRPDARVRWFGGAEGAAFTGLETMELPPISVSVRPAPVIRPAVQPVIKPAVQPVNLPVNLPVSRPMVAPVNSPVAFEDPSDINDDLLELSDDISLSSNHGSSGPMVGPVAQQVTPAMQPTVMPAPVIPAPVIPAPVIPAPTIPPVPVAEIPAPRPVEQPLEVTWPMVIAAWSELLAFTERRTDAARGSETFDRTWRESCIALAERYPVLDPFFADVKYAAGILSVRAQTPSLIEALVTAYQHSLARLGIPLGALEPLVQPIRARHEAVWAAAGLEVLWRR